MLDALSSALAGVVFGLALAAPPGPMNAVIAEESVLRGWGAGFKAGLGALSADATFFLLALVGVVGFVERYPTVRALMVGVGGLLMVYFAYGAAKGAEETFRPERVQSDGDAGGDGADTRADGSGDAPTAPGSAATSTGFRKAFVLALANPYQILFWLTMGVGLLRKGEADLLAEMPYVGDSLAGTLVVETGSPALVVGFFAGILLWATGFPAALVTAERRVDEFAPVVAVVSALVLAGFGVVFLYDAVTTLL
ncbi:LysE family translocator [Halobium salinum]|uniref:LysE family translocator n=1 Tax=Halobium salinum TaxID=1364940 RepID=A0ABD5PCP6_9EURY|nr:LysE family transporter [Halobium salinum]